MNPWDQEALLDHAGDQRDDATLERLWRDHKAHLVLVDATSEVSWPLDEHKPRGPLAEDVVFLGLVQDEPWFARRGGVQHGVTMRDSQLDGVQLQIVASALAALNWATKTRVCSHCGGGLRREQGGFTAVCRECGRTHFPRTDPVSIFAILNADDELFLAHQASWAPGRVSILAGFIEAGESAENAVHREALEESSLKLDAVGYIGSQPWPFPRSLMFGFVARAQADQTPHVDGVELQWGRFYDRDSVRAGVAAGDITLPGPGSIARRMLDAWLEGRLPAPEACARIS